MRTSLSSTILADTVGRDDAHAILRSLAESSAISRSYSEPSTSYSQSSNLIFELSAAAEREAGELSIGRLLVRRPVAAVGLLPQPLVLFSAGACAGALGKDTTAPRDMKL